MKNSVVLITGALTGIGHATALAFAREGNNIVISGRNDEKGELLVKELKGFKIEAEYIFADVRREEDVRNLVDWTKMRFGNLDAAVNLAGIEGRSGLIVAQTAENFSSVFETNVLGIFLSLKHELRVMLAQGHGSIVNVSSTYGRAGGAGAVAYTASKHAVEGLTKSAALEAAESGVRVNVVAPGPVETGMLNRFSGSPENKAALISRVPMKRIGQPAEIAQTIVFLSSEKASFITGTSIAVDGGKLAG